jgi:hypothetical protein
LAVLMQVLLVLLLSALPAAASLCCCRFAHAHDARLAYDQVIRGLGLAKPTNYCPGDYELDNPEVEAKLEQFRKEHPDAVAKALAAAALAATVTAEDGETKTTVHDEVPEHGTEAAARGTDAAAADAGVSACDADMTEAAAPSVTPVAEANPAAAVTIVSEVTPAAAAAAEPEQASAGSPESSSACCTTDTSNSNSSSPCSSDNKPHSSAACQELSATEHASTPFSGLQQLQLQQPLVSGPTPSPAAAAAAAVEAYEQQPKDAADAAAANSSITSILPKSDAAATGATDVAAADADDLLSQFETIMQLPDVSQLPDVHQLPDVPQLPDIPQLQLTFDDLPWVQHQQQQQQLECNHSLLGPLYSFSLGQPAATAAAVGPAAATDPAALAAAVVPASEILAAWVSSQGQDQSNQQQQQQQQESCAEPPVRTRTLPVRRTRTCSNLGVRSSSSRAASEPLSGAKRSAKRTKSLASDDFTKTVAAAAAAAAAPVACQTTAAAPAGHFAAAAADSSSGSCFEAYMPASLAADAAYANSLQAQPAFTAAAYEAAVAAAAAAARPVQPSVCSAMQPTLCAAGCGSSCGVYCAAAAAAVGEVPSWQQPVAAATAASYAAGPGHFAADELELLQLVLHSRPMLS